MRFVGEALGSSLGSGHKDMRNRHSSKKFRDLLIYRVNKLHKLIAPNSYKKNSRYVENFINMPWQIGKQKIFCISMQRTGTTSVGDFLVDHGFRVARWADSRQNNWSHHWNTGNLEAIFQSIAFKSFQAYEDEPWWFPDFYRVLHHRFPKAKFILFHRDSDQWFDSMKRLFNQQISANPYWHCRIYGRLSEYFCKLDKVAACESNINEIEKLLSLDEGLRGHYKNKYNEYYLDAMLFFKNNGRDNLFVSKLEDDDKWVKLGKFLGIKVNPSYNAHAHNSSEMR